MIGLLLLLGAEDRCLFLSLADEHDAFWLAEFCQILRYHAVLALALAELDEGNVMVRHHAFQLGDEVAADRLISAADGSGWSRCLRKNPTTPPSLCRRGT